MFDVGFIVEFVVWALFLAPFGILALIEIERQVDDARWERDLAAFWEQEAQR